ncbi:hypothetical protein MB46_12860 [Arthrobacter alpinus]|uniref:carbohydrate kinase family protein n=1 Tax=Arthrobacter alpinus TaxID=656366 RepID=UPI0005CA1359|nr:adenosine kinase [Arthrobacter alpinus]ALV46242.1 hypothetical protein MB46_12860 [Arthrobacter alpinus]
MLGIIGDLVQDVIVWLEEPLRHGTDTEVEIFHTRGGSAANVASFATRLGPTRFIGCVGDDPLGDTLVNGLTADGIDVRVQRRGTTGTIVILIDQDGERTMLPYRGAATLLDNVPDQWLDGLELLHIPAYTFKGEPVGDSVTKLILRARQKGILVSIDASSTGMLTHYGVDRFLRLMQELQPTFLIGNQSESEFLGLCIDGEAGPALHLLPDTIVVTKAGADPTVVLGSPTGKLKVTVPPVTGVRDLTGAGDAFAAGFLATFLATRDLKSACVGGHSSAARVLCSPGASMPV